MAAENTAPVGVFVIILFLLIGLIVMGCMLYMNWIHHKQRSIIEANNFISSGNACIYEKTNPRPTYNRSSNYSAMNNYFISIFHIIFSIQSIVCLCCVDELRFFLESLIHMDYFFI